MSELGVFSDIADVNPRSPAPAIGQPVSFIGMADVSEQGVLHSVTVREATAGYTPFVDGDVLVAKITPCLENGKGAHVRELPVRQGQGSTEFHVLRALPESCDRYLYHLTRTEAFRLRAESLMTGSAGQRRVPTEFFHRYQIRIPPLKEQRRIAEVLDTIDDTLRDTDRIIEKLKNSYGGLASDLLRGRHESGPVGDVDPAWSIGRLPDCNSLPESWAVKRLIDVCGLESGHTPARTNAAYWGGEIGWVSLHDTSRLQFGTIYETELTVTQAGIDNSSARVLPAGTIALSRTATVGKAVELGQPMATSQDFACFPPQPSILLPRYLLHLFRHMAPVWSRLAAGSTHQTIYMPIFRRLEVAVPPLPSQRVIVKALDDLQLRIDGEVRYRARLHEVRQGLADDLLSGRVRTANP